MTDLEELKKRLSDRSYIHSCIPPKPSLEKEALDAIEQLQRELEEARRDAERLDFLNSAVMDHGSISANRDRDHLIGSPTFGPLPTVTLFTVPSQHVKGEGLRAAIDAAMQKEG